ncbi:MAG TPA: hypothetical protein VGN14_14595, partial [Candidatus Elarobacter sp.]
TLQLDQNVRRNSSKVDSLLASLNSSAVSLNATATSIQRLAQNPQISQNLLDTTRGLAQTSTTIAEIAGDFRKVTSNPQTQAQLTDTIANTDAATQKLNSILAGFGGVSHVYGVDRGATPAPAGSPGPGGRGTKPGLPAPEVGAASAGEQRSAKANFNSLVHNLLALQVRIAEYDAQKKNVANTTTLLTRDQGPSTDFNLVAVPHGAMSLLTGANDVGGPAPSWNFALMQRLKPGLLVGGGVLYSRLGGRVVYNPSGGPTGLGFEGRVYDLRHPTADGYANLRLGDGLMLFGGERDVLRPDRRTTFGLQLQF